MQQNMPNQKYIIIAVVAVLLLLGGGYYMYSLSIDSNLSKGSFDVSLVSDKKIKDYYAVKDKIDLKDMSFTQKSFYKDLKDNTTDIPPKDFSGRRHNPFFAPYATP